MSVFRVTPAGLCIITTVGAAVVERTACPVESDIAAACPSVPTARSRLHALYGFGDCAANNPHHLRQKLR